MTTERAAYKQHFLQQFEQWKAELPLFRAMERTVEGSPWHREANVLVHTQMVVDEYVRRTDDDCDFFSEPWSYRDYLGAVAVAFHDVGKPVAEKKKWSESRGDYRSYGGHEIISARLFTDWAASNVASTKWTAEAIYNIAWMIEHHMPWEITDREKLNNLAITAKQQYLGAVFMRVLYSDQWGRISDDTETKRAAVTAWIDQFNLNMESVQVPAPILADKPRFIMLIGPSGSGKSTYLKQHPEATVYSLDELRHRWYDAANYERAYALAVKDSKFENKAQREFSRMLTESWASQKMMIVDNVNASAKRRRWYLSEAKRAGYQTAAVLMTAPLDVLHRRQRTRTDKSVPESAVTQQYMAIQLPQHGEFDAIYFQPVHQA